MNQRTLEDPIPYRAPVVLLDLLGTGRRRQAWRESVGLAYPTRLATEQARREAIAVDAALLHPVQMADLRRLGKILLVPTGYEYEVGK